ncbi:MAG: serine protease [Pseudomonadota bacterium]
MRQLLSIVFLMLANAVSAQTTQLRALDTEYAAASYKAVGRIDFGRNAQCSGTLIARDLVLTAAHCLYKPGTDQLWPVQSIRFHAGLRNGAPQATRRASAAAAHADFRPLSSIDARNVTYDVALIRLSEPISTFEVAPFYLSAGAVTPGPVSVVSYGRGRSQVQSRQKQCQLLAREGNVLELDCDVTFGSSGAPVFSHNNGRGQIVGVISSMSKQAGEHRAYAMTLPDRVTELKRQMNMQVAPPRAKIRRLTVGGDGDRNGIGAKFVRPGG